MPKASVLLFRCDFNMSFLVPGQNHFLEHDLKLTSDDKQLPEIISQFESEVTFL